MGAVVVYLNGRPVLRQGVIASDPARVQARGSFLQPGAVPTGGPAEQVLAVRYAPWRPPLSAASIDQRAQFLLRLNSPQNYWLNEAKEKDKANGFLVFLGISALLALLHLAFFRYNPTQRANLYFACSALTAAIERFSGQCTW